MKTITVQAQQRWEYCFENRKTENSMLVALNELGQQGWELVDISHHKDMKGEVCWTAFLKRPSAGQATAPGQTMAPGQPAAGGQTDKESPQLHGFDLSGKEFQLKTEDNKKAEPGNPPGKDNPPGK